MVHIMTISYIYVVYSKHSFVWQDIERSIFYSNLLSFGGYGDRLAIVAEGDRGADKRIYSLSTDKVSG